MLPFPKGITDFDLSAASRRLAVRRWNYRYRCREPFSSQAPEELKWLLPLHGLRRLIVSDPHTYPHGPSHLIDGLASTGGMMARVDKPTGGVALVR